MHDRHEDSINAILNFLANVFRKSLEEQGGDQSISDLLASIVPNAQNQMHQHDVVDLGEFVHQQSLTPPTMSPVRQAQHLLPPIPTNRGKGSDIQLTKTETEALQRMQEEEAPKLDELSSLLGPTSPSVHIPGLDETVNPSTNYFDDAVDINEFLDPGAFNDLNYTSADLSEGNVTGPMDGIDFNIALDSTNDFGIGAGDSRNDDVYQNGHAGETNSANNTPSAVATEEIHQNFDSPERDAKRRRKG
jgi:hypothetical protein